jgi:chemotaxis protein methyltransferase CheR
MTDNKPRTYVVDMELQPNAIQLEDRDFDFLCRLIYEQSRIRLGPDKRTLVTGRLAKRLRQLQLPDYHEYCQMLRSPAGKEELHILIDRVSTNHTHFFREMKHFDFLRGKVLPQWRERSGSKNETFHVWSAASSSGEEPYSLAIYLAEYLAPANTNTWQIEASDISTRVLKIAEEGVYEEGKLAGINQELLHRYFQKGLRDWQGHCRIKGEIRERIDFCHLNLLDASYPFSTPFHVIFCRNVMIYFDRSTQETLIRQLSEQLVPGGYLMVGHSESLSGIKHSLRMIQPAIYRKPA